MLLAGLAAGTAATGGRTLLGPVKDLVFFGGVGVLADLDFIPGLISLARARPGIGA